MLLNEAQKILLRALALSAGSEIKLSDFDGALEETTPDDQKCELASYIVELCEWNLVRIKPGTFAEGGRKHPVYKNDIKVISFDRLNISSEGQTFAQNMI